ncbi:MAG: PHP domain-containing protein [Clostridiales bacterium]|nr:PHP domain-containing protein [Clostridiales bacterium]
MKYIDLHVHSNISDGTFTPTQLVEEAIQCGLSAFALTDHDTTDGVAEALDAAKEAKKSGKAIEVISGTELSVAYKNRDIHMLGLFLDYENFTLQKALHKAKESRENRNKKMAENLEKAGFDIDIERLSNFFEEGTILTRAHFAQYLFQTKQIVSVNAAFRNILNTDGPYYVPRKYIEPENAIRLIKQAGGIPILAHPLIYHLPEEELDALIARLKEMGLEGIEVFYSANTGFDEGILRQYANKYNLVMSGGSDFHGANKPLISLGTGKGNLHIPYSVLDHLKKRL